MNNGYWGKLLRVNLTERKIIEETIPDGVWREYLGGVGLAAKYIRDEVPADVKPLDPANRLMFVTGPFQMGAVPGSGRWEVCSISPLTNRWGEANGGGFFGSKLKRTGFDAILFEGRADKPVYLLVNEGIAVLKDAGELWGHDSREAAEMLEDKEGKEYSFVTIGQAGEKMVPMACILSDKAHGVAGRCGMGAVMGSKNLKAVGVSGNMTKEPANKAAYEEVVNKLKKDVMANDFTPVFRQHGEPIAVVMREGNGLLPIKNWTQGTWKEGAEKIGAPTYTDALKVKPKACSYCPVACHRHVIVNDGRFYDHEGPGAEYETLGMFGSLLMIDDLKMISYANDLCNRYGIDTISTGGVLGFIFECYEKGMVTAEQLDGIKAEWGNADALVAFVHKIGEAEGIGIELAKGSRHMAELIGGDSSDWAMEVNNLEIPAHDPRSFTSMACTYATSNRGACHLHGLSEEFEMGMLMPEIGINEPGDQFSNEKKGMAAAKYQDWSAVYNSLIHCIIYPFFGMGMTPQIEILNALNGWDMDGYELIKAGERINTVQHLINIDRGFKITDYRIPKRLYEPLKDGATGGHIPDLSVQIKEFLKIRDWDENGIPTDKKLEELNLER